MKKCPKCGAVQSDGRNVCLDCGTLLGRAMTKEETAAHEDALDERLSDLSERTEDFYVPLRDKVIGIIALAGIIAAIVLLVLATTEKNRLSADIPEGVVIMQGSGGTTILSDGTTEYRYPSARLNMLNDAALCALGSIVGLFFAAIFLLKPRFMWNLDTLKYRLFYNWDTTPSDFALIIRKVFAYLAFAVGILVLLNGWRLFL